MGDDLDAWRLHGLVEFAGAERRLQPGLGLGRTDEHDPGRRAVRAGRAHFHQIVNLLQLVVGDRAVLPAVMGPGRAKQCIERGRSEEHTSELQSLMRISYAVFCLKKKTKKYTLHNKLQLSQPTDEHNT